MDIQSFGVVHLSYDSYTTLGRKPADLGAFPTGLGLTCGVLPFRTLQAEAGFDWMEPSANPLVLNAKIGFPEGALFGRSPALQAGVFNLGFRKGATDMNVLDAVAGISLPAGLGRIHAGGYWGNGKMLVNPDGERANAGFMAGYDRGFLPSGPEGGQWNRLVFAADYMSGRNALGAGGAGLSWYFSPAVAVLMGPVWFNAPAINGDWKWTTQLDANF